MSKVLDLMSWTKESRKNRIARHKADPILVFIMRYLMNMSAKLLVIGVITITFCPERTTFGQAKEHIVHFPPDKSLGILYTRDSSVESRESWQEWEELGQARGEISISHGKELQLAVSDNTYQYIAEFSSLRANDIKSLLISCRNLQDSDIAYLKGLTGLQSLSLSSGSSSYTCPLTGKGFVYLKDMSSLRDLALYFTMIDDESLAHLKYLTSLESLRFVLDKGIFGEGLVHLRNLPSLHFLWFGIVPIEDSGLKNLKGMSQLETLGLGSTQVTDEGLTYIKDLTGLKTLFLPSSTTDAGLASLSGLSSLEELYISGTKVTDDGLTHLKDLPNLKSLRLGGRYISGRGLRYLHDLPQLKDISISMTKMDDEGMKCLKGLTSVTSLNLERTQVSDDGFANLEGLTVLKYLCLSNTAITDDGLDCLKDLTSLETLRLDGNLISDGGLANLQNLASLRTLSLVGTDITDAGLMYLKGIRSLKELYLSHTRVSDAGLVNLKELHSLQRLFLDGTNVSGEGFVRLKDLKSLRTLRICVNNLSEAGVENLKKMTWLHELVLGEGSISDSTLVNLRKSLPDCVIDVQEVPSQPPEPIRVPLSLVARPLPVLTDLGIILSSANSDQKIILVCFFDINQRPSRNCIMQLSKRVQQLKAKDVSVIAVQASKVEQDVLNGWLKDQNIPFQVGMVQSDEQAIRLTWGVKSLPWLILTDSRHLVIDAGFGLNDLDDKIKAANE